MWPEKDIEYVKLQDDAYGRHFGLFIGDCLVSVISLFTRNHMVQFRKFATLQERQGQGYGSKLLAFILNELEKQGVEQVWCHARTNKINFYQKFGLKETGERFIKDGMEYSKMGKDFHSWVKL